MCATEIPLHILFRVAALLMGHDGASVLAEFGEATRHRPVVAEETIAVQFDPIREAASNIVERERAAIVPCQLHALPGREVIINRAPRFADLAFHGLDFGVEVE